MKKKEAKAPTNMAVVSFGWHKYVMPVKDATAIINALTFAEGYESTGYGDEKMHYIGGEAPDVSVTVLSEAHYLQGKFAGVKEKESDDE